MWCRNCNIETNEEECPICGEKTIEDLPTEVYWCKTCKIPIIQTINQADKGICPICGGDNKILVYGFETRFPRRKAAFRNITG